MSHGTPLAIGHFARLAGPVVANLPREMDSQLALDLAGNGDALEIILAEALTRANLDRALIALGKKSEPKPAPKPLLIPIGTATVAATEEPIVLSAEVLRERYNIKWHGDNLGSWFFGKTLTPFGGSTLAYKKLSRRSVDGPIVAELGGAIAARMEPIEMLRLVELQKHGESGPLLTNGYANIFYWEDQIRFPEDERVAYTNETGGKVVLRAVRVHWSASGVGWCANAFSVLDPSEWSDEGRIFSRSSRLPSAA